jgi:hypothetical protein
MYVNAVILCSRHPDAMTPHVLHDAVEAFLREPRLAEFTWYLDVSESRVAQPKVAASTADWINGSLDELEEAGGLERPGAIWSDRPAISALAGKWDEAQWGSVKPRSPSRLPVSSGRKIENQNELRGRDRCAHLRAGAPSLNRFERAASNEGRRETVGSIAATPGS